ncbi:hypothetical protein EYS14_11450 [Alteromonadaceae bacterium M269]|nr:hypothetical protein EYS14_11450 [Alteromonadaceae bacterium M269]
MEKNIKRICLMLLFFSVSSCSLFNYTRLMAANNSLEPTWNTPDEHLILETEYIGNKPQILASVNGVDNLRFVIDTGARVSFFIDTDKVKSLNLPEGYGLSLGGVGDSSRSPAYKTRVDTLNLGGVSFKDVGFAYMPATTTPYYLDKDEAIVDGVLGHDVIQHFHWQLNKAENRVSIYSKESLPMLASNTITIPAKVKFRRFKVPVRINLDENTTIEHEMILDTGSRHFMKINTAYLDNEGLALSSKTITAADFGLSGQTIHQRTTLPKLMVGDANFPNIKTNLVKTDDEDDFWYLGSALFSHYDMILDYQRELLHLTPIKGLSFASRYNLIGLELRKLKNGNFIVRYILPDMPAFNTDLTVGDEISSIDGQLASNISLDTWLDISNQPGQHQICVKTEQERCLSLTSSHIIGYSK